ncbi:MAG: hypothetical protein OD918_05595 [Gammaproteobacteria bacterium]
MKLIKLGKNAFAALEQVFASLDTEAEEKRLANEGKMRGAKNLPGAQANRLDAVEQGIVASIAGTVLQTKASVQAHFAGFLAMLAGILPAIEQPDALIGQIQFIRDELKADLDNALNKFKRDSAQAKTALKVAEKNYAAFRSENGLDSVPEYDTIKKIVFLFACLVVAEAFVSSNLLWGFLGVTAAFFQTALITLLNVGLLAWMFGTLFRWKNLFHKYSGLKAWICGVGGSVLGLLLLLAVGALNLGVGHYRDAIVDAKSKLDAGFANLDSLESTGVESFDPGFFDYAQRAMQSMKSSLFGIDNILSGLLCLVGLLCFIFAAYKWYSAFDPYPGYRARHRDLEKQRARCNQLVEEMRQKIAGQKQNADNRISDPRTKLMTMRAERGERVNHAHAVQINYDAWVVVLKQKQDQLFAIYRGANAQARSEPAPEYFEHEVPVNPQLTEAPGFSPPHFPESEAKVLATVESVLNENQENYRGIDKEFHALASTMHEQS